MASALKNTKIVLWSPRQNKAGMSPVCHQSALVPHMLFWNLFALKHYLNIFHRTTKKNDAQILWIPALSACSTPCYVHLKKKEGIASVANSLVAKKDSFWIQIECLCVLSKISWNCGVILNINFFYLFSRIIWRTCQNQQNKKHLYYYKSINLETNI